MAVNSMDKIESKSFFFEELSALPLGSITEKIQNTLHIFIQIFVLLYAHDTVIFFCIT
jgi:hypothetical protein